MQLAIYWARIPIALWLLAAADRCHAEKLTGTIRDDQTGQPIAARLYIRSELQAGKVISETKSDSGNRGLHVVAGSRVSTVH